MAGSYIISGARTPIGKLSGALASFSAAELGGFAIAEALQRAGVAPHEVEHVIMGQVLMAGQGQVPSRQAAAKAGIPMNVPSVNVNKVCLSGLNAIYLADQMIANGEVDIVVAGGMESMTNSPYLAMGARSGFRFGDVQMLDAIQRELDSDQVGNLRAAQAYIALLSVWIERQALRLGEEGQKNDAARRLVARFTALMEEKFRSGVGVGLLAAELGVTPTHLTRCCRQTCSRSAIDLLQDRRIFEARKLLAETKLRINVIGTSLGFTSAAYFTRAFQNRTGSSPREFRRNL